MNDYEVSSKVVEWWKDLTGNRVDQDGSQKKVDAGRNGDRAELRRCSEPQQVLMCKGFHRLRLLIGGDLSNEKTLALGAVAGLCSHIKTLETKISFPAMLATPTEKEKTSPPLSELRFQKIVKSRTPEDLYTNLRRAINILKNKGNITSITNGVFLWYKNRNNPAVNIQDTLLFQWSNDYFNTILKKETKPSK